MVSLFQNITLNEKGKILKLLNATIFTYQKGVNVSYSFNDSETVGVILEGSLDIVRIDYNGNRTIIDTVYEDELFGSSITSIINNDYEIVTKEEVRILWIDYNHILKNSDTSLAYNQFLKNLLSILLEYNILKNERIEILTQKTIRNKLLEYFRLTAQKNKSKVIYLKSTWQDLADYLAIDRSAMSRELKNLKDEGFIIVKGRVITLCYSF
ncbi:MAG: Crp/Fnr family transcriptional regulator [bacterium]|nr:Crp/Fnr family transcriptional regulator [bacterium]